MDSESRGKAFLILGGRSPIAIGCSLALARTSQVIHVTRHISAELEQAFSGSSIEMIEHDLSAPLAGPDIARKALKFEPEISGVAFLQRYRPSDVDSDFGAHMRVEVWSAIDLLRCLAKERLEKLPLTALIASSPAAGKIVSDQSLEYHIVKSAQESSFRYLARELSPQNVECVSVRIGSLVIKERAKDYWNRREEMRNILGELGLAQGLPTAETIGRQLAKILENGPLGISGQTLELDGGLGLTDGPQAAKNSMEFLQSWD